jgi:hypothetical protein
MMVAVPVLALCLSAVALLNQSQEYAARADQFAQWATFHGCEVPPPRVTDEELARIGRWRARCIEHWKAMEEKYRIASSHPWLSVTADPPEPTHDAEPAEPN